MSTNYYDFYQKNSVFSNEFYSQFLRSLGKTYAQCADIGECFITLSRIKNNDFNSWYNEWNIIAETVTQMAEQSEQQGHTHSAGKAYLRAAEYHRNSEFFLRANPHDARILPIFAKLRFCFERALSYLNPDVLQINIPFEQHHLPGYYFTSPNKAKATLIIPGGYDSIVEEQYPLVSAALSRGYDAFIFDGPGQGHALREQGITMRPDFENALSPVLNWLDNNGRNKQYIGIGRSLGGYLMPRAACFESRLIGLVCDPGQMNLVANLNRLLPEPLLNWFNAGKKEQFDLFFAEQFNNDPMKAFYFQSRMATHHVHSVFDYIQCLQAYSFADLVAQIKCPTLVCDNPLDTIASSSKVLYDALSCEKTYALFTAQTGAGSHCEMDAYGQFEQVLFDWLDEHWG